MDQTPKESRWRGRQSPAEERDMRKIVAAMQMSVDGFIEGPNGEVDWVD
jgi:hypothetical protein